MTTRKSTLFTLLLATLLLFAVAGAAQAQMAVIVPFNTVLFNPAGAETDGVAGPLFDSDNGQEIHQLGITPALWNQMNTALAGGGAVEIHYISGESINIINGDAGRFRGQVETILNQGGVLSTLDLYNSANAESVPGSYGASVPHAIPIVAATFAGINVGDAFMVESFSQAQASSSAGFNFASATFGLDNVQLVITP